MATNMTCLMRKLASKPQANKAILDAETRLFPAGHTPTFFEEKVDLKALLIVIDLNGLFS